MYYHLNRKSPLMLGLPDQSYITFEPGIHLMTEDFYDFVKNNKSLTSYIKTGKLSFNTEKHESLADAVEITLYNSHDIVDLLENIYDIPALEEWSRKAIDDRVREAIKDRIRMLNGSNA